MQRAPLSCPSCSQLLGISWDMWGQYYVCQGCGFTAEDDDELKRQGARPELEAPLLLTTPTHSYRLWQALEGR